MIERRSLGGLALLLAVGHCSRWEDGVALQGAGATFPYPLYSKWIDEYRRESPNVFINYQSIGSGGGVRQLLAGTVDFAATDVPMNREELGDVQSPVVHLPMAVGAIALSYNVPNLHAPLRFTPELLAEIFFGNVKNWGDPTLRSLNPAASLPDLPLNVVYRTDGSGTTAIFTEFLAEASPLWRERVGAGKLVRWPVGLGAKGNEGVAGQVQGVPGSIGYIELAYATQGGLATGLLRNRTGRFVGPSVDSAVAAARAVAMPSELHVSLAEAASEDAYPLSAYTYLVVYRDARDRKKGEALGQFLWWAVHDGQKFAVPLGYAPLPTEVVGKVETALASLRVEGKAIAFKRRAGEVEAAWSREP